MALLWIEGFEGFGTVTGSSIDAYLRRKYPYITAGSPYWYLVAGRTAGYGLRGNQAGGGLYTPILTYSDTSILGAGIKLTATATRSFLRLYDWTTLGLDFQANTSTGEITVYRGTTSLGTTSGAGLTNNVWAYVEIKAVCSDAAGTVEIKVNGVSKLALSGVDTKIGTNAYWSVLAIGTNSDSYIDDVYWADDTGSVNNDWIGIRKILGMFPSADSGTVQWDTSSGSSHYELVDELLESTSDYVESGTVDQLDLYDYANLADIGNISGIQIMTSCRETNAQSFSLLTPIKSGGTEYDGDATDVHSLTTETLYRIVETDPNTSALWTLGNLNSAQFGVKIA